MIHLRYFSIARPARARDTGAIKTAAVDTRSA